MTPPIDRRGFIGVSAATAFALSTSPLRALAQLAPSNFTELRGGVGTFVGQGGTIGWFISEDAAVVIDSQFPRTAGPCRKGLEERSSRGLDLLINTHHHGDHTGGNGVFKDAVKKIVAHKNVPDLQKKQATERGNLEGQVFADTLFDTEWNEKLGKEKLRAKYYGGAHTGGDAVIWFEKANVAHTGDLVFNRWHPYIDLPSGGTIVGWAEVLQMVHDDADKDTIFIFGHGSKDHGITGDRKDVLAMRDYFRRALDHVAHQMNKGASKEEIIAAKPKGFDDYVSPGDRMSLAVTLQRTYEDLEKRAKEKPTSRPKG